METLYAHRKEAGDHQDIFLAGHQSPAGTYRERQTGREVRLAEEEILPATCDGHVGVYVRQHFTWAEVGSRKGEA